MSIPGTEIIPPTPDGAPTYSYRTYRLNTADSASYSEAAVDIGVEAANRRVVVLFFTNQAYSLSSATIGGVAATLHGNAPYNPSVGIASAIVPTGATGTIAWTYPGVAQRSAIGVFALYGLKNTAPSDFQATGVVSTNASRNISLTMPKNSIAIVGGAQQGASAIAVTNLTSRFNVLLEGIPQIAGGDYQAAAAESRVVTMNAVAALAGIVWV